MLTGIDLKLFGYSQRNSPPQEFIQCWKFHELPVMVKGTGKLSGLSKRMRALAKAVDNTQTVEIVIHDDERP